MRRNHGAIGHAGDVAQGAPELRVLADRRVDAPIAALALVGATTAQQTCRTRLGLDQILVSLSGNRERWAYAVQWLTYPGHDALRAAVSERREQTTEHPGAGTHGEVLCGRGAVLR